MLSNPFLQVTLLFLALDIPQGLPGEGGSAVTQQRAKRKASGEGAAGGGCPGTASRHGPPKGGGRLPLPGWGCTAEGGQRPQPPGSIPPGCPCPPEPGSPGGCSSRRVPAIHPGCLLAPLSVQPALPVSPASPQLSWLSPPVLPAYPSLLRHRRLWQHQGYEQGFGISAPSNSSCTRAGRGFHPCTARTFLLSPPVTRPDTQGSAGLCPGCPCVPQCSCPPAWDPRGKGQQDFCWNITALPGRRLVRHGTSGLVCTMRVKKTKLQEQMESGEAPHPPSPGVTLLFIPSPSVPASAPICQVSVDR